MATNDAKRTKQSGDSSSGDNAEQTFVSNFIASINNPTVNSALSDMMATHISEPIRRELTDLRVFNAQQASEIKRLNLELARYKDKFDKLSDAYSNACQEIADLQQYTRRNALRITNPAWPESQDENTDELVLKLAQDLGVDIQPWEISRSHRVGVPRRGKTRTVLVKFIGYRPRERLYKARWDLKDIDSLKNVYINEDLTKATSELAYKARMLKKDGKISSTFTSDGKVFVKKFSASKLEIVKNQNHLDHIAAMQGYSQTLNGPPNAGGTAPGQDSGTMPQVATRPVPTVRPADLNAEPSSGAPVAPSNAHSTAVGQDGPAADGMQSNVLQSPNLRMTSMPTGSTPDLPPMEELRDAAGGMELGEQAPELPSVPPVLLENTQSLTDSTPGRQRRVSIASTEADA